MPRPPVGSLPPLIVALLLLSSSTPARAETGYDGWLRYAPITDRAARDQYAALPAVVVALGDSPIVAAAQDELIRGTRGMLGRTLRAANEIPGEGAIILGTYDVLPGQLPTLGKLPDLSPDGYWLRSISVEGKNHLVVAAPTERGVLYGAFALLRMIGLQQPIADLNVREKPYAPIRILNHWDNLDGTIERGYAGRSIFWEGGHVTKDLGRVRDYARLMASVGINGCSINNVNADVRVISPELLPEVARVAGVFRPYGVKLYLSLDFASPRKIGGINTFDPLDPAAVAFWKRKVDEIYKVIPDLGGFVLKADSEGRLGPSEYGRTHADAANVIAQALEPHGGILFYRGFVYDHKMDWKDPKNDRAKAAYDNFHPLDGKFRDNVIVQIKNGPIDFQVREPASPLFGGLTKTNQAIELQITQEYLGQQRHLVFLVPMWKEVLDFDMKANPDSKGDRNVTRVKDLVSGLTFKRPYGGFVGVSNVGRDPSWLGHQLAMANLYGFGRLAWNPDLESKEIAEEWTRLTFGPDPKVVGTIVDMLLKSWSIYENYTGPNGVGTLTDIINVHYGPGIESSENNGWGQWHRADDKGIGMDRTVATGTGFIGQYSPAVARVYESLDTCPDELLLFMHHVPYDHELKSGKSLIQHIYDSHYEGARDAARLVRNWQSLEGPHRRTTLRRRARRPHVPGRPRPGLARRGLQLVPPQERHRRRQETRRQPSQPHRSRVDAARWLRGPGRDALGNRLRRPGRRAHGQEPPRHDPLQVHRQRRLVRRRRRLLRRERRRLEVQALRRQPARRPVGRRRHAAPRSAQRPHLDAPQNHQRRPPRRRRNPPRGHLRPRRTSLRRLLRDRPVRRIAARRKRRG